MRSKPAMRAFVAISLEPEVLGELKKLQQQLRQLINSKEVRWTQLDQTHLTLAFFAALERDHLPEMEKTLQQVCRNCAPFSLTAEKLGCFPDFRNPRVVWIGVGGELERLRTLQAALADELRNVLGYAEEQVFRPHLTLARISTRPAEGRLIGQKISATVAGKLGAWTARQLDLYESTLGAEGARHTRLLSVHFELP